MQRLRMPANLENGQRIYIFFMLEIILISACSVPQRLDFDEFDHSLEFGRVLASAGSFGVLIHRNYV